MHRELGSSTSSCPVLWVTMLRTQLGVWEQELGGKKELPGAGSLAPSEGCSRGSCEPALALGSEVGPTKQETPAEASPSAWLCWLNLKLAEAMSGLHPGCSKTHSDAKWVLLELGPGTVCERVYVAPGVGWGHGHCPGSTFEAGTPPFLP